MNIAKKVIGVFGTVGMTGISAILYNHFTEDHTTIINSLKKTGYQILNDESSTDDWTAIKTEYEYYRTNSNNFWGAVNDFEELKKKCKSALSNKRKNTNDYSIAKRFCVKKESMLEMLSRNNYEKISPYESTTKTNRSEWEKKVNALRQANEGEVKIKVDISGNMDQAVEALSNACKAIDVTNLHTYKEVDFENKFLIFKKWCSIEKDTKTLQAS